MSMNQCKLIFTAVNTIMINNSYVLDTLSISGVFTSDRAEAEAASVCCKCEGDCASQTETCACAQLNRRIFNRLCMFVCGICMRDVVFVLACVLACICLHIYVYVYVPRTSYSL